MSVFFGSEIRAVQDQVGVALVVRKAANARLLRVVSWSGFISNSLPQAYPLAAIAALCRLAEGGVERESTLQSAMDWIEPSGTSTSARVQAAPWLVVGAAPANQTTPSPCSCSMRWFSSGNADLKSLLARTQLLCAQTNCACEISEMVWPKTSTALVCYRSDLASHDEIWCMWPSTPLRWVSVTPHPAEIR